MKTTSSAFRYPYILKIFLLFLLSNNLLGQEKHLNQMVSESSNKLEIQAIKSQVLDFDKDTLFNRIKTEKGKRLAYDESAKKVNPTLTPKRVNSKHEYISANDDKFPFDAVENKKEDISRRDAFSKHFINGDGSYTALIGAGPIHYLKDGQWKDISTKVVPSNNEIFPFENTDNIMKSYFGATASKGIKSVTEQGEIKEFLNTRMYWEVDGVEVNPMNGLDVPARVEEDKVYYDGLFGDISAEYTAYVTKRKLNYLIPDKASLGTVPTGAEYLVFSEDIYLPQGWSYELTDKGIVVYNDTGNKELLFEKPEVFENYTNNPFIPSEGNPAEFQVLPINNGLRILLKVQASWLMESNRVFPLAIDPTVVLYPNETAYWSGTDAEDGYVFGSGNLLVGFEGGYELNGFLKINLASLPYGCDITAARTFLYHMYANRQGTINNQRYFVTGHSYVDPVTASAGDVFDGFDGNMTGTATQIGNSAGYKYNPHNAIGLTLLENDQYSKGFTTLLAYPYGTWDPTNYAVFGGYIQTPAATSYLEVTYTVIATDGPCEPSTDSPSWTYIDNVYFFESLNPEFDNPSTYTGGYQNFTGITDKAKQQQGGAVNLFVTGDTSEAAGGGNGFARIKAWVDWNKDGDFFDDGEQVYDSDNDIGIITNGAMFGFNVPDTAAPGNYRLRVRNHKYYLFYEENGSVLADGYYTTDFSPCTPFEDIYDTNGSTYQIFLGEEGEAEDYLFEVVAKCDANVVEVENFAGCNVDDVELWVKGTSVTTGFNWYDSDGNFLTSTTADANFESTYAPTVPNTPGLYTFYVTASSASCESLERTKITVNVLPVPEVEFEIQQGETCGSDSEIIVSSNAEKEVVTLIDEDFNSGMGSYFTNIKEDATTTVINDLAKWQNRTSVHIPSSPEYKINRIAFASGIAPDGFVLTNNDVWPGTPVLNHLQSITLDTTDFLNLILEFKIFCIIPASPNGYLHIDVSTDDGSSWTTVYSFNSLFFASPNKFGDSGELDLSAYINQSQLKIRFSAYSWAGSNLSYMNIISLDDIQLYGDKYVDFNFDWTTDANLYEEDCTTAYSSPTSTVCLKPTQWQLENEENIDITVSAMLTNGCSASGNISLQNNTKVWNTGESDWATLNWKPGTAVPTADNCVIIRTPVNIPGSTDGVAKNLKVETGGSLTIQNNASLTVTDFIHNEAGVDNFIVKSGGSLVQINDDAENSGEITAERTFTFSEDRQQYNYVISPVIGQTIKNIYTGAPFVIKYVEGQNWFVNAGVGPYVPAKGYAIKEATGNGVATVTGVFKGVPANGLMSYPLQYGTANTQTGDQYNGYNLVGNPYPSNLDLDLLYNDTDNKTNIDGTFQFWDNRGNEIYAQQGSNYQGANYAKYNAANGTGIGSGEQAPEASNDSGVRIPTRYVRPGTAFMVRALDNANGQTLNFKNAHRSVVNDSPEFFGKNSSDNASKDRYWLTMRTPSGIEYMTAVVYFWNGNNDFTLDDSEANGSSDDIYTLVGEEQIAIHGRAPFVKSDKVPLGVRLFEMGTYVISLYDKEGVFANGQNIYIRDKKLKTIYNLTQADYKFIEDAGEFNDRFEIIYIPNSFTADNASEYASKINIEKKDGNFVVTSEKEKITQVEVFALNGRSAFQKSEINNLEFKVPVNRFEKQIIVFVVETETGEVITKKFVNK
ncbi:MAG: GEVED domain-containing protein [Weeksellaceae bacterium]